MAIKALTDEQIKWASDQYLNGRTSISIANDLCVNGETVRKWLKKNNVKMRTPHESLAAPVNDCFFEKIDTELKAYWLGFLIADACIGKSAGDRRALRFFVAARDKWVIDTFATDIEYKGKLRLPKKPRNQWGICFNNKKLCGDLINYGYLDWKNGSTRLLEFIPDYLFNHFIRGFFDGDGCISYQKRKKRKIGMSFYVTIVAHLDHQLIMEKINNLLIEKVQLSEKLVKLRKNSCVIGWNGNRQVKRFGDWLYANSTRFLQRKKDLFLALDHHLDAFAFDSLTLKIVDRLIYASFLDSYHYLGCGGRNGYTIGLYYSDVLIGIAMISSITRVETATRHNISPAIVRELARFCIHPEYHFKNIPTWFLSRVIKKFKQEYQNIKLLISFADTTRGHEGTIYKAANWIFDGLTGHSYSYLDSNGTEIHKKTIYGIAKRNNITERQYADSHNLKKLKHKQKKRFILWL